MISPTLGRVLSAAGAAALVLALLLTWYHVDRATGTTDSTGWQTFPRLRAVIVAGAVIVFATALARQVRPVLLVRTLAGLVVGALILRRIIDPPDLTATVSARAGVYVGFAAALAVVVGGLVDTGRRVAASHSLAPWSPPAGELPSGSPRPAPRGGPGAPGGAVADGTAEGLR